MEGIKKLINEAIEQADKINYYIYSDDWSGSIEATDDLKTILYSIKERIETHD